MPSVQPDGTVHPLPCLSALGLRFGLGAAPPSACVSGRACIPSNALFRPHGPHVRQAATHLNTALFPTRSGSRPPTHPPPRSGRIRRPMPLLCPLTQGVATQPHALSSCARRKPPHTACARMPPLKPQASRHCRPRLPGRVLPQAALSQHLTLPPRRRRCRARFRCSCRRQRRGQPPLRDHAQTNKHPHNPLPFASGAM